MTSLLCFHLLELATFLLFPFFASSYLTVISISFLSYIEGIWTVLEFLGFYSVLVISFFFLLFFLHLHSSYRHTDAPLLERDKALTLAVLCEL